MYFLLCACCMQLVINAGSSSLKWAVFASLRSSEPVLEGVFERIGGDCLLRYGRHESRVSAADHSQAVQYLLDLLVEHRVCEESEVRSCVHRVVHGGERYSEPVLVDERVLADIDSLSVLAPLHNPANLAGVRACMQVFSSASQVAVFDTAFHQTIPEEVFLYAIPIELYKKHGIRKYGFHGISHSYIASLLRARYGRDVDAISCHLGSGSSVTALRAGVSVDTTMGFTPLDGLLMSTRSGELDPEIPLFLMRQGGYSLEEVEELLSKRSGLFGLTGHADLREVWAEARRGGERCQLALEMLCYRVAFFVNALKTATPRPRALVFTAGIGERAWYVRERVCEYLGVPVSRSANKADEQVISVGGDLDVLVLPTDEQLQMHVLSRLVLEDN